MFCFLLAAAAFFVWRERHFLSENPFRDELRLEAPSQVSTLRIFTSNTSNTSNTSKGGFLVVVDKSKTRVSVVRDWEVHGTARGGRESEGSYYYAEYAVTDGKKLYIADIRYASVTTGVAAERIMQYSLDGRFEKVLFLRNYPEPAGRPLQYGNIRALQYYGGALSFVLKNGPSLELYRFPEADRPAADESAPDGSARLVRSVAPPGPEPEKFDPRHVVYSASRDAVYAMTLRAVLYAEEDGTLREISDWSGNGRNANGKNDGIPWGIAADSRGKLFVTDLARRSVAALPEYEEIFKAPNIVYNLYIDENDILSLTDTERVFLLKEDGKIIFSGGVFAVNGGRLFFTRFLWGIAATLAAVALFHACSLIVRFISRKSRTQTRLLAVVALSTAVTSTLIGASLFGANSRRLDESRRLNLIQLTSALSEISPLGWGGDLQSIETLGDHEGEAFARIRSILAAPCDSAEKEGSYLYYMVYKFSWENNALYGVMDYENTLCTVYPMGSLRGSRYGEAASDGALFYESDSDNYGSWTYAVAPVRNSRMEIVGLLEFGYNLFSDRLANARQVRSIAFDTAVLIVLFLLLFSEGAAAAGSLLALRGRSRGVPELVRPIMFIAYFAMCTDTTFISPLAARIFEASGAALPISGALSSALPLSLNLVCSFFASAAGAKCIDGLGTRRTLNGGILTETAGRLFCFWGAAKTDYGLLLAGMALTGLGMGMITAACDAVILSRDEKRRGGLFADFNAGILSGVVVGVSIGSYVSKFFGYAAVFVFSAVFVFLTLFLGFLCVPSGTATAAGTDEAEFQPKEKPASAALARNFWKDKSVWSFFSLSMFPFLVILCYKDYLFPLYANGLGYSEVTVGQVLLFSGAAAIWFGPPVTEYLLERLGAKYVNAAANALYIAGILVFAVSPSLETAVSAACVTTAAAGFGLTAQNVYFTNLEATWAYGCNRAMGAFNAADSLFLSVGPILFGALLPLGYRGACAIVGAAGAVFLVLFLLLNRGKAARSPHSAVSAEAGR
ncbi:MAG: MFS transporter [Synergistaceae bacterium]|nr:MFS transporter [Synergistaceae bacterium]